MFYNLSLKTKYCLVGKLKWYRNIFDYLCVDKMLFHNVMWVILKAKSYKLDLKWTISDYVDAESSQD